jgi:small subunit ribosomal protein S17
MSRRVFSGVVVSDVNDKTVVVRVERFVLHPLYKKRVRRHNRYAAHDPENSFRVGDCVEIVESRPISKTKKWLVHKKISG